MKQIRKFIDRSQVLPFEGANEAQFRIARCFAMLTDFTAAMQGKLCLSDLAQGLIRQVDGANLVIYRLPRPDGAPQIVADAVRRAGSKRAERPTGALARRLLAVHEDRATPGSIWRLSELREDPEFASQSAGREWLDRPEVIEVSLIVMERTRDHLDLIEIQFDRPPHRHKEVPTLMVTAALADAWSDRAQGLIVRLIAERGRVRRLLTAPAPRGGGILGPENPFALSRSEKKVCHALGSGLRAVEIAQMLNVSLATVRTHLRNIYSKTGCSRQVDVMARLQADARNAVPQQHAM